MRAAIDLGIVHVEPYRHAACSDCLAQAVQAGIQTLAGVELGVWDEAAGIIQRGLKKHLLFASARPANPWAEEHVALPDLIGKLGFVLFMRGSFVEQQLALGEATGAQETIECGSRQTGLVPWVGHGQLAQQSGPRTMGVLALEPFDEGSDFWRDGAGLSAILARLGRQRGQSVAAIAQRPVQQRVHRDLATGGMGNVVEAGGDLLGATSEFAAGQRFQHQGRNQAVSEERDFFGFVVHGVAFSPGRQLTAEGGAVPCKWCVGSLKRARWRWRMRHGGRREPDLAASPAGGNAGRQTGSGER